MDLKERVQLLEKRIEELEEEKQLVRQEIEETVEFASSEDLAQEFIDYYYWETGFPSAWLAKGLGIKNAAKAATPKQDIDLPCVVCGKSMYYEAVSKYRCLELFKKYKERKRPNFWGNFNEFVCPDCIEAQKATERERKNKEQRQDNEAQKRVELCGGNDMDLAGMPYSLFLKTDYWKKFAAYARKEAEYTCQECGAVGVSLHVHHLTYERRGRERLSDVKVLCKPCHENVHGRKFR